MDAIPTELITSALHVAPHPDGGWIVEDEHRRIAPSRYADLQEAVDEAEVYATARAGWRVIVHDQTNPAVGEAAA
jgi:hypothetical protein